MRKKKVLLAALVAATMAFSTVGLASCDIMGTIGGIFGQGTEDDEKDELSITWTVDKDATVKVEGADKLPETAERGAKVTFTVSVPAGYKAVVKVNNSLTLADNGKYSVEIKRNTKINVSVEEIVSSVTVTGPENPVYYAGETIKAEDWTVTVAYETGRTEVVDTYTVNYGGETGFAIGDIDFTVEFGGVKSAAITLGEKVEAKITIDANGGTIADAYVDALKGNTELHNVTVTGDTLTFTFAELTADVALPTAEQLTKGEQGDYVFSNWTGSATSIAAGTELSASYTAKYEAALLKLESLKYENRTVDGENVPYLIIKGTFNAAQEAYLYLYEGNEKISLIGDTVGGEDTQRGDEFEMLFDMRKLAEKGYKGKWMDIKFRASLGDRVETQDIDLTKYSDGFVDKNQTISNGDYTYSFQIWESGEHKYLKAMYSDFTTNFTFSTAQYKFEGNETETLALVVSGTAATKYAGNFLTLDFYMGGSIKSTTSEIGMDGSWTVYFEAASLPLTTDGYAHISIKDGDGTAIYPESGETNLDNGGLIGEYDKVTVGLINDAAAFKFEDGSAKRTFYVGAGKWGGIVAYGRDEDEAEKIDYTNMELKVEGDKLYMVISGTYGSAFTADTAKTELEASFYADLQAYPSWEHPWKSTEAAGTWTVNTKDDGTFTVVVDLSEATFNAGKALYGHIGTSSTNLALNYTEQSITYNGLTFTVGAANSDCADWMADLTIIYVTLAESAE